MCEAVRVHLEWLEIPTTPMPPDSPYPCFGWDEWRAIYPYSLKTDVTRDPVPARHRTVVLENRYVRVTVLPDMGGRVLSLYDKVAGQESFMVPPTLRFRNVAARGAWLAGGIEFNFGRRGHTVFTVSPVTWAVRRGEDGSACVWIGSLLEPIESRWAVRIQLKPERAALDLQIRTMGPQTLPGMMYWWTNAGVEVTKDSRFYFFGRYADAMHCQHSWPVRDGLDFSWWRNRYLEADMFLRDTERDYLGFYDFRRHHGLAQVADRHQAPGQKYFTWGNHLQGRYWDRMFSDTRQTYCEIQRGRFATQAMIEPLPAMAVETWWESWIPIRGTEGFSATDSGLVLSVTPEGAGRACIRLLGVEPRSDLQLEAHSGRELLGRWRIDHVSPERMFTQRVGLKPSQRCDRVRITDAAGAVLMDWQEYRFSQDDWFRAADPHQHRLDKAQSDDELFHAAERLRWATWPVPRGYLHQAQEELLKRDPGHPGLLRALAEQDLFAGRHERAVEHLRKALRRDRRKAELLVLLGWALLRSGQGEQAASCFAQAGCHEQARRNALVGLTCAHLHAGSWEQALAAADHAARCCPHDPWVGLVRVMALRKAGRAGEASELLRELLEADPLWSRLHAEALLLGMKVDLAEGQRRIGDDSVAAAAPYIELRLWDDARQILQVDESNEPWSPAPRLAHLAYVLEKLNQPEATAEALAQMRQAPLALAHPASTVSIAVLEELAQAHPDEPAIWHMLGNVLASRQRHEEAGAAWQRAQEAGLEDSITLRNLALLAARRGQHDKAVELYRRAWENSGQNLYLFSELDRYFAARGLHEQRRRIYDGLSEEAKDRSIVAMRRILQLLDSSMYVEAMEELSRRTYLRGEYERGIRYNYVEAVIGLALGPIAAGEYDKARAILAKGLEYPQNLNMGRHGELPNESPIHYLLGVVEELAGSAEAAREHYLAAAHELHTEGTPAHAYEMLAWLALGNRPRGMDIAHRLEQMARGELETPLWFKWHYGPAVLKFTHALAQLAKGRIDEAREMWRRTLEEEPDARWVRLHLDMPECLLKMMSRLPGYPQD